ncbi:Gfo/Idh/MocA family oxidoreductase [Croceivirga sp. JEA036]|uniref:Gfo/Idh/MocA family oxidoreductase n=1 Tax=Croceivirga sp. JEA036 TaxID=2721162 RepID=UPI00143A08C9|nr:Gfo/Idh/MocA family oxidoreductase [Croceivirga sp. JEA036]NJB35095.1 Gfo/Idh/MocA family oxidoreductase [Croceivirga sp. JEA036]
MNNTIKTGIAAFGMSGSLFHAPFLRCHPQFEFSAVVERSKKKVHLDYENVKSYNSFDALLSDESIELVVVNTPNETHFEFALKAIKANKHVLIDKPFTTTAAEAKQLFKEAKKKGVFLLPYQNRRYDSDFLSVKEVVESGKLGNLVEVHFRYDRFRTAIVENSWKEDPAPGNGVIYNLGAHPIDGIISLFGIPLKWSKHSSSVRPNSQVNDYEHVHLLYPNNLRVFVTISLLVADPQPAFVLNGTMGTFKKHRTDVQENQLNEGMKPDNELFGVELPESEGILTTIDSNGLKKQEKIAAQKANYMNVFEDVYQTLRMGKGYPVTEEQIIAQLEILE